MTTFTVHESKFDQTRLEIQRPRSLLASLSPIRDNKYLIVKTKLTSEGTEVPTVLKEYRVNTRKMKCDVQKIVSPRFLPLDLHSNQQSSRNLGVATGGVYSDWGAPLKLV